MISTRINELNNIIEDYKGITILYGAAATGKTTICLIATISELIKGNKVIFLDTENGFSIERFKQINNDESLVNNLLLFTATSFKKQLEFIRSINAIRKNTNVGLIIVDSLGNHYRRLLSRDRELANGMLINQIKTLKELSKSIPVLVTNQVYTDIDKNINKMIGNDLIKKFIKSEIELKRLNNKRFMRIKNKLTEFIVDEKGISIL